MPDSDPEGRVADIELALRQIMDETGVSRMQNGQPLYIGAYKSGLATFVRKVIAERERTGWINVAHNFLALLWGIVALTFIAWFVHVTSR